MQKITIEIKTAKYGIETISDWCTFKGKWMKNPSFLQFITLHPDAVVTTKTRQVPEHRFW